MNYVELIIDTVMDAIEDFFNDLRKPTNKYIKESLIVSLIFLLFSFISKALKIPAFISPIEALLTTSLLCVVYFIDKNNRSNVKRRIEEIRKQRYANDLEESSNLEEVIENNEMEEKVDG